LASAASHAPPPNGYTLSIGHWGTHVVNGAVYRSRTTSHDLEPVAMIASNPLMIVANASLPARDLKELIAWLKANPGKASAGTAGSGSATHIGGIYFQNATGTRFELVPYKGSGPAMLDLVGGRIELMIDQASNSIPQVRGGKIKALRDHAKTRLARRLKYPPWTKRACRGLHVSVWYGIWAPRGTPRDVVAKLNAAVVAAPLMRPCGRASRSRPCETRQASPPPGLLSRGGHSWPRSARARPHGRISGAQRRRLRSASPRRRGACRAAPRSRTTPKHAAPAGPLRPRWVFQAAAARRVFAVIA